MGLFDDDGSGDIIKQQRDMQIDQQFRENQAELKGKKDSLYAQRLDIIKSSGGQNWNNTIPTASSTSPGFLGGTTRRNNVGRDIL